MKGFKFRLEALSKLRNFEEETCKIELGKINKQISYLQDQIHECEKSIRTAYDSQNEASETGISARELQFYPIYVEGRQQNIKVLKSQLNDLASVREKKIKELSILRGKSKVLEKLEEKEKKKYKKAFEKEAEKSLEEEVQKWEFYRKES